MSSQHGSKSSRPTRRASYPQLHPEESRKPDPDTLGDTNAAMPPQTPPTPESQVIRRTKRPRPYIFKSKPFSQTEIQGAERPARPSSYKPKPLHALEITDLYPDDDPKISAAPLFHGGAPPDAATGKSSTRKAAPPPSMLHPTDPFLLSGRDQRLLEERSRFLLNEDCLGISSSYHLLPFPASLNRHQHVLPLHTTPSLASLSPSEQHLLRPQCFLSFLIEYTASFVNYVFDISLSYKGRYGLGRAMARRDTYHYGERESVRDG